MKLNASHGKKKKNKPGVYRWALELSKNSKANNQKCFCTELLSSLILNSRSLNFVDIQSMVGRAEIHSQSCSWE